MQLMKIAYGRDVVDLLQFNTDYMAFDFLTESLPCEDCERFYLAIIG